MNGRLLWGGYQNFEGWVYYGTTSFVEPAAPTFNDHLLATLEATEGGRYGSVNAYDSCGVSCSLIQVCEFGLYGVSDLLGFCIGQGAFDYKNHHGFQAAMAQSEASFNRTAKGTWRFSMPAPYNSVDTKVEQQILFFGAPNVGERGTWTDSAKQHASTWVQALGQLFDEPGMHAAQNAFCALRLRSWYDHPFFVGKDEGGLMGAVHAAYVSFAANRPESAKQAFNKFLATESDALTVGSEAWAEAALRDLTFAGIAIWPHRYDSIRPVLERDFGVDLPDLAADLKATGNLLSPVDVQRDLIAVGYDLGPSGADGAFGPKSKQALLLFQQQMKLGPTGIADSSTCVLLREAASRADQEEAAQSNANPTTA